MGPPGEPFCPPPLVSVETIKSKLKIYVKAWADHYPKKMPFQSFWLTCGYKKGFKTQNCSPATEALGP